MESFIPFFDNEHQTWQETQPFPTSGVYLLVNDLDNKVDETANTILLLAAATSSDRETYANLAITVTSLTTKLSLAKQIS